MNNAKKMSYTNAAFQGYLVLKAVKPQCHYGGFVFAFMP